MNSMAAKSLIWPWFGGKLSDSLRTTAGSMTVCKCVFPFINLLSFTKYGFPFIYLVFLEIYIFFLPSYILHGHGQERCYYSLWIVIRTGLRYFCHIGKLSNDLKAKNGRMVKQNFCTIRIVDCTIYFGYIDFKDPE